jgi:SPW repeat
MRYSSPSGRHEPEERRWQDVLTLLMSAWVIIAPWFNGAGASPSNPMHAQIAGALLFVCTVWALARQRNPLPEYVNAALGCWLLARPFWGDIVPTQRAQLWVIGALVVIFAVQSVFLARHPASTPPFPPTY